VPDALKDTVAESQKILFETLADVDEEIGEMFVMEETPSREQVLFCAILFLLLKHQHAVVILLPLLLLTVGCGHSSRCDCVEVCAGVHGVCVQEQGCAEAVGRRGRVLTHTLRSVSSPSIFALL
jgi:hypothetical protein